LLVVSKDENIEIYTTVIIRPLTIGDERSLMGFQKRVLRRLFGLGEEVTGEGRHGAS
jgi:hypothetical protein